MESTPKALLQQAQAQLNALTPEALNTEAGADQLEDITLQLIELQLIAFEQDKWGLDDLYNYLNHIKTQLHHRYSYEALFAAEDPFRKEPTP